MTQQVPKPTCFGRVDAAVTGGDEGWDPQSPFCAGGPDQLYTNESTGSHVRDRCLFFSSCGAVVQAKKNEERNRLLSVSSLVRPAAPPTQPPAWLAPSTPSAPVDFMSQRAQQEAKMQIEQQARLQAQQQYALQQQQLAQQRAMQAQPPPAPYGYQQMMPVNYQMPAYLTVPEPVQPGSFWKMLGTSVLRSMGKSLGHSIANVFDTVPLGSFKPPGER